MTVNAATSLLSQPDGLSDTTYFLGDVSLYYSLADKR